MVKMMKHELKENVTIVLESIYNLNTNKLPSINHGIENKFGIVWANKAFKNADEAFKKLNEFTDKEFDKGAKYLEDSEVKEINTYFHGIVASNDKKLRPISFKINDRAYNFSVRTICYDQGDTIMTKNYGYIVTKTENYFNPEPVDNIFSTVMGVFHDKQDAIDFVNQLVEEEKAEWDIEPEPPYVDNNSDANYVYSVDFIYRNEDESDPNFGEGSKTTYRVDRYEIK